MRGVVVKMRDTNIRKRTIMIFPKFSNQEIIDEIRKKYDPLYNLVKPHITLVFPFKSDMSNVTLSQKLEECLKGTVSFSLSLQGISRHEDVYGNYIFLNVKVGREEIIEIHNSLYLSIFDEQCRQSFIPHMTIGNIGSAYKMESVYNSIKNIDVRFETIIKTISVEMIGDNDESIIIIEKKLC